MPKYVVFEENTLCYRIEGSQFLGVLSAKIGGRDWKNGPIIASEDTLRAATAHDFDVYRVQLPPDFVEVES
jgi:hypothetical protein